MARALVSASVALSMGPSLAVPARALAAPPVISSLGDGRADRAPQGRPAAARPQSTTAAQQPPAGRDAASQQSDDLGVSLDRIRRGLARSPSGIFDPDRPTFQVYIEGRLPTFSEFYVGETFGGGPAGWVPRGHLEYLDMVTPREAQPFGAFTGTDLLLIGAQSLASGLVANALFNTIPRAIREGRRSRQEEEARREVQEVLAELARRQAQAEAGKAPAATPPSSPIP